MTHTVNFGIGSAFSKGPGPGPILYKAFIKRYKVCLFREQDWDSFFLEFISFIASLAVSLF